ncbi:MAG: hypothetical protein H0U74_03220 [Bradymonadaceae bacterium]|nr:hypothetical protein [Lujinxingiaceae bacterium]
MKDDTKTKRSPEALDALLGAVEQSREQLDQAHADYMAALTECQRAYGQVMASFDTLLQGIDAARQADWSVYGQRLDQNSPDTPGHSSGTEKVGGAWREQLALVACARPGRAIEALEGAASILVTDDGFGVAPLLVGLLSAMGHRARLAGPQGIEAGVDGIIFLGGLRAPYTLDDAREVLDEALALGEAIGARLAKGAGFFVTVQDTGGGLGLAPFDPVCAPYGGILASSEAMATRFKQSTVRAIDLGADGLSTEAIAQAIVNELICGGEQSVIGLLGDGRRVALERAPAAGLPVKPGAPRAHAGVIVAALPQDEVMAEGLVALSRRLNARVLLLEQPGSSLAQLEEQLHEAGCAVQVAPLITRDFSELMDTLFEVRARWGPIGALVYGVGQRDSGSSSPVDELNALIALTINEPLGLIGVLYGEGEPIVERLVGFVARAERMRRELACEVRLVHIGASLRGAPREQRAGWIADELMGSADQVVEVYLGARSS